MQAWPWLPPCSGHYWIFIVFIYPQWAVFKRTSASALCPLTVCSLPPWLGPPLPQWRCICTAVKSQGSPPTPIHSGSSMTADGERSPEFNWRGKDSWTRTYWEGFYSSKISTRVILTFLSSPGFKSKRFAARLQWRMVQCKQMGREAARIPGSGSCSALAAIVTCVSIVVHREGLVAVLAVAQRGQGDQTGVIFYQGGNHINRRLRSATTVREILRPLGLTHQAFDGGKDGKQRCHQITQPTGFQSLGESLLWSVSNYIRHLIRLYLGSQPNGGELHNTYNKKINKNKIVFITQCSLCCWWLEILSLTLHWKQVESY